MNPEPLLKTGLLSLLVISISGIGCNLINPAEPIPARIELEPFDLQVQSGQGSALNKITDVWIYANDNFLGIYNPPVEVDYLGNMDQTKFVFRPGIRNNGIANDPIVYPLYTDYTITLPTNADTVSHVKPVTHYKTGTVVSLDADFENIPEFTDNRDTVAGSFVAQSNDSPIEGNYSGVIVLTKQANFIEVGNNLALGGLPTNGTLCYLEFQYKSEMEMSVGLLGISLDGQSFSNFFYLVNPSENWNMLYIDLTSLLQASGLPAYKILFRSIYPADATKPELRIQLDNVKVVHL